MVFGTTTTASLMASVVLELKGWAVLNYVALALVFVALLVIGLFRLRHPARAPEAKPLRRWGFSRCVATGCAG